MLRSDERDAPLVFTPGSVIAQRYRIVSLLGKGGMGEVYRADDLRLGQQVALKFLPRELAGDPELQERFLGEVRIGRQVTHPNVCRLYDLVEVGGNQFIAMEYVDGEDLSSLLTRIGRLAPDKALAVARDLCAGLAAAHEAGVVHRDLKPANVMLDGRGRARITDFGLALVETKGERGVVAGTPAYMAPEQLAGGEVTSRSDIYALGLVLYEIFTGKRVYAGRSYPEIVEERRTKKSLDISSVVREIDPRIERLILACLEDDPALRPASAKAILAALPGGDPLEAALALGETPSPAVVAAAGEKGDLSRRAAWCLVGFVVAGLAGVALLSPRATLRGRMKLPKSPEVLLDRAKEIVAAAGISPAQVVDSAFFVFRDDDFLDFAAKRAISYESAVRFRYRTSPRVFATLDFWHRIVGDDDPPLGVSGMTSLTLDTSGRLERLVVVPPERETPPEAGSPIDWSPFLRLAGLEPSALAFSDSIWAAPVDSDRKLAWTTEREGLPLRVEAASYHGRPVFFSVIPPWQRPHRMEEFHARGSKAVALVTTVVLLVTIPLGMLFLAWRNLRAGRSDRRGATKLAAFVMVTFLVFLLFWVHHPGSFLEEWRMLSQIVANAFFVAAMTWITYVAFEPTARRRWPHALISWSRLLEGKLVNPMIGRDILIGAAGGLFVLAAWGAAATAPDWLGIGRSEPLITPYSTLVSPRAVVALFFLDLAEAVGRSAAVLGLLVLLRVVIRKEWILGTIVGAAVAAGELETIRGPLAFQVAYAILAGTVVVFLIFRFGLLALSSAAFVILLLRTMPLTLDPEAWYFGRSSMILAFVALFAFAAFYLSLGGKAWVAGSLVEE